LRTGQQGPGSEAGCLHSPEEAHESRTFGASRRGSIGPAVDPEAPVPARGRSLLRPADRWSRLDSRDVGVAGAAGIARMADYLRAFPDQVAALLAVELCTLTVQRNDRSVANLVASSLFGDGAAAVVATGADRTPIGPRVLAARSRIYPDTEEVMGWRIGSDGFKIMLSVEVATVAEKYLAEDVRKFLADHGLTTADVSTWVCHPGGPRVIEAVENVLDLPADALDRSRTSLRDNGNLSSVSVLDVLRATVADPPAPGSIGLMIAMGPGFCSELVLLGW
jgi:alkylresorcinol/alkylpyrone synthase